MVSLGPFALLYVTYLSLSFYFKIDTSKLSAEQIAKMEKKRAEKLAKQQAKAAKKKKRGGLVIGSGSAAFRDFCLQNGDGEREIGGMRDVKRMDAVINAWEAGAGGTISFLEELYGKLSSGGSRRKPKIAKVKSQGLCAVRGISL